MQQTKEVLCYQVTCKCGEEIKAPFDRFHEKGYVRWVASTCGLQSTKEGLEDLVEQCLNYFYGVIKNPLKDAVDCKTCDLREIGNPKFKCKNSVCNNLKRELEQNSYRKIKWQNVNINDIKSPDELAKLFISKDGARSYKGPASADISDLLKLIDNCIPIRNKVQNPETIDKVITSRNKLMHSNTMTVKKDEFDEHMGNCINLLRNMPPDDARCKAAIEEIKKMRVKEEPSDALDVVEKRALQNLHKANTTTLEKLEKKCETATGEKLMKLKRELFEKTQLERERKVMFTLFDIDTSDADKRTTQATKLFDGIEERQENERITLSKKFDKLKVDMDCKDRELRNTKDDLDKKRIEYDSLHDSYDAEGKKYVEIERKYREQQNELDQMRRRLELRIEDFAGMLGLSFRILRNLLPNF